MPVCPDCGLSADEGTRFCARCGRQLGDAQSPAGFLTPLPAGTVLGDRLEIVALLEPRIEENRYRARRRRDDVTETYLLRERVAGEINDAGAAAKGTLGTSRQATPAEADDPAGPRAKTAELTLSSAARQAREETAPAETKAPTEQAGEEMAQATPGEQDAKVEAQDEPDTASAVDDAGAAGPPVSVGENAASAEASQAQGPPGNQAAQATGSRSAAPGQEVAPLDEGRQADDSAHQRPPEELGELFARVLALSRSLNHPAFVKPIDGMSAGGRAYLVYPEQMLTPLAERKEGLAMREADALALALQVCQAVSFLHRRGLRLNDICPASVALTPDGRVRLTGLDHVTNDLEQEALPLLNDGYTAPEIYRGRPIDKRADIFSVGALVYSCLTGRRLECESWREEGEPIVFYPPAVVTPALEQVVRRALAFDPHARWATIDEFKLELVKLNTVDRVRTCALTDVGKVRELNEDSLAAVESVIDSLVRPRAQYLYVVADGMGGAAAGEVASAIAVDTIAGEVNQALAAGAASDLVQVLVGALEAANRAVLDYQADHPEARGMGSTAVAALIRPPEAAISWVGDSRAYLLEGQALRQLSKDHSLVQRLVDIGQITPEEARHHEHKNVITRSLGARRQGPAGAEGLALRLKRGDRMLLCSDGLVVHVDDSEIGRIMERYNDPRQAARELIAAANAGGGTDNISVIVVFAD